MIDVNGTELYVTDVGEGRPLFSLHGGMGWDHSYFRPWLDGLGGQARVFYYDQRGHGRSGHAAEPETLDHDHWTGDLDALRGHFGYDTIVLFGHSYGAILALEYALRHPERIQAMIICACPAPRPSLDSVLDRIRSQATAEQITNLREVLSEPVNQDETFRSLLRSVLPLYFYRPRKERCSAILSQLRVRAAPYNRAMFHELPLCDVHDQLGRIETPTLVLAGKHDWLAPPDRTCRYMSAQIPNATCVVFDECGHFPFIEETSAFTEVVTDWLYHLS